MKFKPVASNIVLGAITFSALMGCLISLAFVRLGVSTACLVAFVLFGFLFVIKITTTLEAMSFKAIVQNVTGEISFRYMLKKINRVI